jgi:hypothetical protein
MEITVVTGLLAEWDMNVDSGHSMLAKAVVSWQLAVGSWQLAV